MFDVTGRYSRHLLLDGIGQEGQARIAQGKVLIVGAGGLGSPVALYLAAAGVGTIGIADGDTVDVTNLQRQVIHATADVGRTKVESAARKMRDINPDINVVEEMAHMMTTQRNYEANVTTMEAIKGMYTKALEIGK